MTPRAVRLYEARGLLRSVDRSPAGYRLFDQRHIEALSFIRDARDLGLTLEEITAITASPMNADATPVISPERC